MSQNVYQVRLGKSELFVCLQCINDCTLHNTNLWFLFSLATGSTGESIQGIPGSKGDDGKPGLPGIPGPRGQSGEIGPAGICDSSGGCHRASQQTG